MLPCWNGRQRSVPWLEHLLLAMLNRRPPLPRLAALDRTFTLIDGTSLSVPGSRGTDWRLHLRDDPVAGRFTARHLTDAGGAESFARFTIAPGDLVVGDRYYAKAKALAAVVARGGNFLVRTGWRALPLRQPTGQPLDLIACLRQVKGEAPVSVAARMALSARAKTTLPVRLIIQRKPVHKASEATQKARRKAGRQGCRLRPETVLAAQFVIVVTSLDPGQVPAEMVLALYKLRWQVELAIKRLKSLLGIKQLPAFERRLATSWLLANLIAALVIDDFASRGLAFSPVDESQPASPLSLWRLHQIILVMIVLDLLADLAPTNLLDQPHLLRRLCEPRRRRLNQAAAARLWLSSA